VTATLSLQLPAGRGVGHRRRRVPAHPRREPSRCQAEKSRPRLKPAPTPVSPTRGLKNHCHAWVSRRGRLRPHRDAEVYVNGNPLNLDDPDGHRPECPEQGQGCAELYKQYAANQAEAEHTYDTQQAEEEASSNAAYQCGVSLNCSIAQFNSFTVGQRQTWLGSFTQNTASRYFNAGNWFNAIGGVLKFASNEGIITPGGWFSWVDASILYGIQGGAATDLGLPVPPTGVSGLSASSDSGPGKWASFFQKSEARTGPDALRSSWAQAEIDSTNFGVLRVAPSQGYANPLTNPVGFAAFAAANSGQVIAYAGSEVWRRTNEFIAEDDPILEGLSVALGGPSAAEGAASGYVNGFGQGLSNCGIFGAICAPFEALGGAASGGWNGLTEGRVQGFFDPRNSWGTYGGAECLYNNPSGAPACIAGLIASH